MRPPSYKVPAQALANKMTLDDIPPQLACLSSVELRLICQVKLFMKIHLLTRYGQNSLKGVAVHFPQDVQEVVEQLPLDISNSDVIFVKESLAGIDAISDYEVSPQKLTEALTWLKANNRFYRNIEILNRECQNLTVVTAKNSNPSTSMPEQCDNVAYGYVRLARGAEILRGTIHQGCEIFTEESRGTQCVANCGAFIAFSSIEPPLTWTRDTIDQVLLCGDRFYNDVYVPGEPRFLTTDSINGVVRNCFGSVDVALDVHHAETLQGFLNKANVADSPKLHQSLQQFVEGTHVFAVILINNNSMAIMKTENDIYLFDSHSRGPAGMISANGTACVLKYGHAFASQQIAFILHRNCQPSMESNQLGNVVNRIRFAYTIVPVSVQEILMSERTDITSSISATLSSLQIINSPARKRRRLDAIEESQNCVLDQNALMFSNFGNGVQDCVIQPVDYVEPDFDEFLHEDSPQARTHHLIRQTGCPLNSSNELQLDVLAFPHLFPKGTNGFHQERAVKASRTDFHQQRLMCSDGRFATNSEYLFYSLSEMEKEKVKQKMSICCSMRNQDNEDDQEFLADGACDPHLYMSAIRGSASYWKTYTGDIIAMIKQLGVPTFFLTFSFDDLNSHDCLTALLKADLGVNSEIQNVDCLSFEQRKNLLNKYPITAARHFALRVNKFLTLLSTDSEEIFGAILLDFTLRIEFQARGSPHAHCLLWLDVSHGWSSPEGLKFLDRNVSCSLNCKPALKDLVLKYQKHKHSQTCFKNKSNKCRFQFPRQPLRSTVILEEEEAQKNAGRFVLLKRRLEEGMINNYHPMLLQILKCNMDIQPVTSTLGIAYYIAKYISKGESTDLRQEVHTVIESIKQSALPARQKMLKIANTLMRNREVSAQEAAFRLCHLFLRRSSRQTVWVPTFMKHRRIRMITRQAFVEGDGQFCRNIIDRYCARPDSLVQLCLYEFAAYYKVDYSNRQTTDEDLIEGEDEDQEQLGSFITLKNKLGRMRRRLKPAVVKAPNFTAIEDKEAYYYSLLLLYLPFTEESFCDNSSPVDVFKAEKNNLRNHNDDPIIKSELAIELDQAILRITEIANQEGDPLNLNDDLDLSYEEPDEIPLQHDDIFQPESLVQQVQVAFNSLSSDQRKVFSKVQNVLLDSDSEQLRLIVSGEGGTGKSHLIRTLSTLIRGHLSKDALLLSAPTGIAAFNISGVTNHRAFALGVELNSTAKYHKLGARKLSELRSLYKNLKFIIIDELSMVNYETIRQIHCRLGEIFNNDLLFGGINILLVGDLMQLKPVRGSWIYNQPPKYRSESHLWRSCSFLELTTNHRQQSTDPLLQICNRLRVGQLNSHDIELLMKRKIDSSAPPPEFEDATWVFPTLKQVAVFNARKTEDLKKTTTVYKMRARDTYADGAQFGGFIDESLLHKNDNKCGGLSRCLELGIGSRVMLRRNLDVGKGLVNGALGTVVGFKWTLLRRRQLMEGDLPENVLIRFDHSNETHAIGLSTSDFHGKRNKRITRAQVPLILAWGINCHKMQGITVNKLVIDIGKSLFAKGMAYVALSRVRSFNGLAICNMDS